MEVLSLARVPFTVVLTKADALLSPDQEARRVATRTREKHAMPRP
jgi:hypothetical protein